MAAGGSTDACFVLMTREENIEGGEGSLLIYPCYSLLLVLSMWAATHGKLPATVFQELRMFETKHEMARRVYPGCCQWKSGDEGGNLRRGVQQRMKAHLPVSEAEDTAAILCVEPLASSSSAPLLLLLLASTVDSSCCLFRKRRDLSGVRKAGSSNASWLSLSLSPSFYCSVSRSIFCFLCLLPASPSLLIPPLPFNFSPSFFFFLNL